MDVHNLKKKSSEETYCNMRHLVNSTIIVTLDSSVFCLVQLLNNVALLLYVKYLVKITVNCDNLKCLKFFSSSIFLYLSINTFTNPIRSNCICKKVKLSRYRSGQTLGFPGD
jgi:hypothetical protein